MSACPHCGEEIATGANFCEGCGAQLGDVSQEAAATLPRVNADVAVPVSTPTMRRTDPPDVVATPRPCSECGGVVSDDGYCDTCGAKAPSERDHFVEAPSDWVAGVCDRGRAHPRNEDAMALHCDAARAVLVVCDGVSSSQDSDVASLAGAKAARDVLRTPLPTGIGTDAARLAAVTKVLGEAAEAADKAIEANTAAESANPASATFTCAVVEVDGSSAIIWVANIGDSRSYWVPDAGDAHQLTVDDSGAQLQIAAGVSREVAENSADAHGITKWLGRDSPDIVPTVTKHGVDGPGWVVVCSDGLWNYASAASALAAQVHAHMPNPPGVIADALVAWANAEGGRDNITVALARVGANVVRKNDSLTPQEAHTNG
ncbi:MAG: protein phosphatase 2C domain-containing protein [Marmoricola sp.]